VKNNDEGCPGTQDRSSVCVMSNATEMMVKGAGARWKERAMALEHAEHVVTHRAQSPAGFTRCKTAGAAHAQGRRRFVSGC
jgi:hypothetical protein